VSAARSAAPGVVAVIVVPGGGGGEIQQQRLPDSCTGGHGTDPHEQNTQQSPVFGRSRLPQCGQAWKNTHASTGMVSVD
jgi:hypothetical protein